MTRACDRCHNKLWADPGAAEYAVEITHVDQEEPVVEMRVCKPCAYLIKAVLEGTLREVGGVPDR